MISDKASLKVQARVRFGALSAGILVTAVVPAVVGSTESAALRLSGQLAQPTPIIRPVEPAQLAQAATQASPAAQPPQGFQSGSDVPAGDKIIVTRSQSLGLALTHLSRRVLSRGSGWKNRVLPILPMPCKCPAFQLASIRNQGKAPTGLV
jgi:hypothetical protein